MSGRGAVHNALSRGQLSAALSRAVGDTVGSSGLERYGETLTPVLDLWRQVEWSYLRLELLSSFQRSEGAVAGEFSVVALVNPTGSGKLFVVERIKAWTAVAGNFTVAVALEGVISATLGVVTVPVSLDTRWRDRVSGADKTVGLIYGGSDAAGIGGRVENIFCPANEERSATTSTPLVIQPGWGVAVVGGTVNNAIAVSMRARERQVFPGELE